jgi:hypothetical protein
MAETIPARTQPRAKGRRRFIGSYSAVDIYGGTRKPPPRCCQSIYAAINAGAMIVNLSLAGDGDSGLLAKMIRMLRKQGVLFFGAGQRAHDRAHLSSRLSRSCRRDGQ